VWKKRISGNPEVGFYMSSGLVVKTPNPYKEGSLEYYAWRKGVDERLLED
jgi:hypothetical protein